MDSTVGLDADVHASAAGEFILGGDLPIRRVGCGTMQLADPGVYGPPKDQEYS